MNTSFAHIKAAYLVSFERTFSMQKPFLCNAIRTNLPIKNVFVDVDEGFIDKMV